MFTEFFYSIPAFSKASDNGDNAEINPGASDQYQQAALPLTAAVKGSSELRYGVKYDSKQIEELYGNFRMELGEALGSASLPESVTEDVWRAALTGQGVYFDYETAIPLDMLSCWLGTTLINDNEGSAKKLILTGDGGVGVLLYYMDGEGKAWRCNTRAGWRVSPSI